MGRVIRPHGVRGALLVNPVSEVILRVEASDQIYLGPEHIPLVVRELRPYRQLYLLFVEGCEDRTTAERWRAHDIYVHFEGLEPLPEHVYFRWQILGLEVVSEEGEVLGSVADILETGANDVYVVRDEQGAELLLPAIEPVVREIDLEHGRMIVHVLPGLRN